MADVNVDWDGIFNKVWPSLQEEGWGASTHEDMPSFYFSPDVAFLTFEVNVTILPTKRDLLRRVLAVHASEDTPMAASHEMLWDLVWASLETSKCASTMTLRNVVVYYSTAVSVFDLELHKTMFESKRAAVLQLLGILPPETSKQQASPEKTPATMDPMTLGRRKRGRPRLHMDAPSCSAADCTNLAVRQGVCYRHRLSQTTGNSLANPVNPSLIDVVESSGSAKRRNKGHKSALGPRQHGARRDRVDQPPQEHDVIELLDDSSNGDDDDQVAAKSKQKERRTRQARCVVPKVASFKRKGLHEKTTSQAGSGKIKTHRRHDK
ncbi:hypothetical protein DYB38_005230 [Aphanomyces astaci]|uniref:Uncharacterized protein n=1 Tax=Aphanomyces astaci TaxID=112090 RepID=A0A397C3W2_APHAT|nr:hypothetical protein DYB38_005230 [Aphanomyces astaci]